MAKKKKNSSPNIPDEVLARIREENAPDTDPADATPEELRKEAERKAERAARRAARRQQQVSSAPSDKKPRRDELGAGVVAEMLANPTTKVDEEAMKVQYGYVISDLRNMGILAGILFVLLLALGFLL